MGELTDINDFIHYYSEHAKEVKARAVKGFYRRAFKTCSEEFLQAELDYITNAFNKLHYAPGKLLNWKRQVKRNLEQERTASIDDLPWITLPTSAATQEGAELLKGIFCVATPYGTIIGQIVKH